jgi:hypothetical protein
MRSPPSSPTKEKSGVRFTNPRGPADKETARNVRPQAYRSFSNAELSTVDQKWGKLFDNDRKPTARLGQFLRGLANHIVSLLFLMAVDGYCRIEARVFLSYVLCL